MFLVYHNPRCKKSRAGLKYLEENVKDEIEIKKYINEGLEKDEIKGILSKLGLEIDDLLRKQEKFYKANIKGKNLSKNKIIELMTEEPKLLQRPVIIKGDKAVIGDPLENIDEIV